MIVTLKVVKIVLMILSDYLATLDKLQASDLTAILEGLDNNYKDNYEVYPKGSKESVDKIFKNKSPMISFKDKNGPYIEIYEGLKKNQYQVLQHTNSSIYYIVVKQHAHKWSWLDAFRGHDN